MSDGVTTPNNETDDLDALLIECMESPAFRRYYRRALRKRAQGHGGPPASVLANRKRGWRRGR